MFDDVNNAQLCIDATIDEYKKKEKKCCFFQIWSVIACYKFRFFELICKQPDPDSGGKYNVDPCEIGSGSKTLNQTMSSIVAILHISTP